MTQPHVQIVDRAAGQVSVTPTQSRVLILGYTDTWMDAPLDDDGWEVWGLNQAWSRFGDYATRWFEIHPLNVLREQISAEQIRRLETSHVPIYMDRVYTSISQSLRYPLERVIEGRLRLFSSTFCYELALAIYEGFKEIGIYGINLTHGSARERLVERRSILYWIGLAQGLGIHVTGAGLDALEDRFFYGLDYWNEVDDVRRQIHDFRDVVTDGVRWWMRWRARRGSRR